MATGRATKTKHASTTGQKSGISGVRRRIIGIDTQVPLLGGGTATYINLDNAASTPVMAPVLECLNDFMPWYSSVHRGTGFKSVVSTEAYETARQVVGRFF
jgi:cysteine desulfurase/selenocysteine lyase